MNFPKVNPTKTKAWNALKAHFSEMKQVKMQDLFAQEESRAEAFSLQWNDFYIDYSKNRISSKTKSLLLDLAKEVKLDEAIKAQFSGSAINQTENRAVLHTALRDFDAMKPEVKETLQKMKTFSEEIISGSWKGCTGKAITDIVNIGVGGSDLGPKMASEALQYYKNHLQTHYISNVDGDHVFETIKNLNPETTLFIIVSKSFSTLETLTNATTIREWFLKNLSEKDIEKHFVAVTANQTSAVDFGIKSTNIFPMWDWVGGRFSLWSAVGLSTCCAVGYDHFESLLKGAHEMDKHFYSSEFEENIPVMLGMLSIWYANFFNIETEAIIPYSEYLDMLVPYLQQAVMESNGKSVDRNQDFIDYTTGTIVWGNTGTNAQHAFFQLIHQGTRCIPVDFVAFSKSLHGNKKHHIKLLSNCFAQSEALLSGTYKKEVDNAYKFFEGNNPSNTILIKKLTPKTLGSLIALYEHKLFVQGVVWNIYSYDQWGVELGKTVAKNLMNAFELGDSTLISNKSTQNLFNKSIQ
ncbi:glucose-6-phosphate isomerase [Marixanthomonas sp. SCSIO 43207]|uniref:glucose-6-phosphate isomerase n=1 Tax=Marixanthomonas sp. SCSIO 43207 TaxID=2779360 RepID=UPI001CA87C51|nr:glucose-6-phosphate isomerase [Marixanthomonas sp. SCSIO 43207]UAB80469.1 glucose-6-phosphate isomerase [Marixanthomonas sp. SCSIO 43207]